MKIAIFTLTKKALLKGDCLKNLMVSTEDSVDLYGLKKWDGFCDFLPYDGKFKETVGLCFRAYDAQIYIMATGIVVRTIAPFIESKAVDPAIIVADENLDNIISLLSGHLGGANVLAKRIASLVDGNPVITTASDVSRSVAVDTFAMDHDLAIVSLEKATAVTAALVNGENVGVLGMDFTGDYPKNLISIEREALLLDVIREKNIKALIYISTQGGGDFDLPWVHLVPRNIVLGIGCKKNMPFENIKKAFNQGMATQNLLPEAVRKIATVDVKEHEEGIIKLAKWLKVDLEIITRDQIALIEDEFEGSDFVKSIIGVRAVAEPCAKLAGKKGEFIMNKTAYNGITIALWEETHE